MKKFAVILSGCGAKDGSEISEVVLSLLSISLNGAEYKSFAPNINFEAKNHLNSNQDIKNNDIMIRNSLEEAARITRGEIHDLESLEIENFDILLIPGGFGIKEILSKIPLVDQIIKKAHILKKPIIAICLAPLLISKNIENTKITYGKDDSFRSGSEFKTTRVFSKDSNEFIFDQENKIYSTPAFMNGAQTDLAKVFNGIHMAISDAIKNL